VVLATNPRAQWNGETAALKSEDGFLFSVRFNPQVMNEGRRVSAG
jgi:hypothetical protein